ncbi:hypothetical protein M3182_04395 [Mesobacillus maritimus]|uniref:hypothetical protein n=1 Tax=Mesobacillus maritimus TaxID=1643336 RepID=UPI00203C7AE2|nr:hypothetical protein [Mesobacillus maritimus]MCM3584986.1 hypothetical protein [Mesobacillus maritimus]
MKYKVRPYASTADLDTPIYRSKLWYNCMVKYRTHNEMVKEVSRKKIEWISSGAVIKRLTNIEIDREL